MKKIFPKIILLLLPIVLGCQDNKKAAPAKISSEGKDVEIKYATGLQITEFDTYSIITVSNPWPHAEKSYRYLLAEKNKKVPKNVIFDTRINLPVEKIVVTSTTHIPSLEILNSENKIVGFPGLDYISSEKTRALIDAGKIKEVGRNEALNTETLLHLQPHVVIGFSTDGSNKSLNTLQKSGIPVVLNADWTETSPLGKAEWIKFFGAILGKTEAANTFFDSVESDYLAAKELAKQATSQPTVLAGSMYKDQWYLPAGESWQAQFIADANGNYLFQDTKGTGSLSLSIESVLAQAVDADIWVGPAQFTAYTELENASKHYAQFDAFKNKSIYTFSSEKGATGGVIFYELAPNRPDLVLKDLIHVFHPNLLPTYEPTFYKPLK